MLRQPLCSAAFAVLHWGGSGPLGGGVLHGLGGSMHRQGGAFTPSGRCCSAHIVHGIRHHCCRSVVVRPELQQEGCKGGAT